MRIEIGLIFDKGQEHTIVMNTIGKIKIKEDSGIYPHNEKNDIHETYVV